MKNLKRGDGFGVQAIDGHIVFYIGEGQGGGLFWPAEPNMAEEFREGIRLRQKKQSLRALAVLVLRASP